MTERSLPARSGQIARRCAQQSHGSGGAFTGREEKARRCMIVPETTVSSSMTMAYSDGKPVFARRAILLEQMEREINA